MDINNVTIIGNLTRDPELKTVGENRVANFTIANNGYKKEDVNYLDCFAWNKTGEIIAQFAKKGSRVCIVGRLKQETWDTPDGKKASKIKIEVSNIQLLTPKDNTSNAEPSEVF